MSTLTTKYRMSDGSEIITTGFRIISTRFADIVEVYAGQDLPPPDSAEHQRKWLVVTATGDNGNAAFGPVRASPQHPDDPVEPTILWVMNETGATVAKYEL